MKLPNAEFAMVDPRKLRDYALSTEHPIGRFKAAFFARLGFTTERWEELAVEIVRLTHQEAAQSGERTEFGQKYLVRGRIVGPAGRSANVVTVWIILNGQSMPRLVTIYPGAEE